MDVSWEERWQQGNTPWDQGQAAPALLAYLDQHATAGASRRKRALVPGCGAGYDLLAFSQAGFDAVGLDVAPSVLPVFEKLRTQAGVEPDAAELLIQDFFMFEMEPFDVVFDYTFFCALPPTERHRWGKKMKELVAPGGELVTLMFPVVRGRDLEKGPPYTVFPEFYEDALGDDFAQRSLDRVQGSLPSREGKEWIARWVPRVAG